MSARVFPIVVAAALLCAQTPARAEDAPAAQDPWSQVPALTTVCYATEDTWPERNEAALEAVQQAHHAQNDVNDAIRQRHVDAQSADPMALAQRMQQAMLKDPANAQKLLEQMQQQDQQAQAELPADQEKQARLEAESKTLMERYREALARAMAPAEARWAALKTKLGLPAGATGPGEVGVPDWAWEEWHAILRDRDAVYVANCAQWWTAGGPVHAYLKRYRDYLVGERTPQREKLIDAPALSQYAMAGADHAGYRSVADYEAAELYLKLSSRLFGQRESQPRCPGGACRL